MPQDRDSGAEANDRGHRLGQAIAHALGATWVGNGSNECLLNGEHLVVKTANRRPGARKPTDSVGVTYAMLSRLDGILAAFQNEDGSYEVYRVDPRYFEQHMRNSLTGKGKVGLVRHKDIVQGGKRVSRLSRRALGIE